MRNYVHSLRSPLIRRIIAVVFLCIIAIESVLLIVSYFSERDRLLARLDNTLSTLAPFVVAGSDESVLTGLFPANQVNRDYRILGVVTRRADGMGIAVGSLVRLAAATPHSSVARVYDARSGIYERRLSVMSQAGETTAVWFRVDAAAIESALRAYVWRIIVLSLVISAFVTVGAVIVLNPILMRPLIELKLLMGLVQRDGLRSVEAPAKQLTRSDEVGDAYRTFESLRKALVKAEDVNQSMTNRFQDFADLGADCFFEMDRRFRFTFLAGEMDSLFGANPQRLIGAPFKHWFEQFESRFPVPREELRQFRRNETWECELVQARAGESLRTVRVVLKPMHDGENFFFGCRGIVADTTVASSLAYELKHQATHDSLTGLSNRRHFEQLLDDVIRQPNPRELPVSVCLLDLDHFKLVNDNCGHAAGDSALKQVAELVQGQIRSDDVSARFGGDEFAVLLRKCSANDARNVAESIRAAFERFRFRWDDEHYDIGVSIGVVEVDATFASTSEVMRAVDAACIKAKQLGRNQVQTYDPCDAALNQHQGEMQWMAQITQAMSDGRMLLYQQPIVPVVGTSNIIHFEVLLRMRDRDGRIYAPGAFLSAAERHRLIDRIDRWVISELVKWLAHNEPPSGVDLMADVNVSGVSLADPSFQEFVYDLVTQSAVNPRRLCFEITETSAIHNLADTIGFLNRMRSAGCRIALDDFGTGFSSLGYLKQLPVDFIKIDGAFIRDIASNRLDRALVRSVAEVASLLETRTIAEFVEDESTLAVLSEIGVDMAQGYLFAKPLPLETVEHLWRQKDAQQAHTPYLAHDAQAYVPSGG